MKVCRRVLAWLLFVVALLPLPAGAQGASTPLKPEELEQIVAPIALHPDALLAQVLMASTYPLEIVEASRFVTANAALKGDQLNQALQPYTWDDSVKSLVMFPQVLAMMSEKLDWLQKLGDAFLAQQQDLMAAIQRLRARAQASGQLKSGPEQNVVVEPAAPAQTTVQVVESPPTVIRIEPTNPQVVYVPSYDPTVVYGAWPPAYPPYSPYPFGYFAAGAFTFAAGAAVGAALWGDADWHHGDVNINSQRVNNFSNSVNTRTEASKRVEQRSRTGGTGARAQGGGGNWQHNPEHRKGVQYRDAGTQQRFNKTGPANAQARESFRGHTASGGDLGRAGAQPAARERQGGQQPSAGIGDRGGQASPRAGAVGQAGGGQVRQAGGFEGVGGGGRDAQSFSSRGNASRQSVDRSAASRPSGGGAAARGGGGGGGARGGGGGGGGRGGGGRR